MSNRADLLGKIRALLAKTVANGCTEAEAFAALDKARAMIDAYEVSDDELKLTKEERATIRGADDGKDPHGIKAFLGVSVALFTETKCWRAGVITFCGLGADVDFAHWLLNTLADFVQSELASHLIGFIGPQDQRRWVINGFVAGCTQRINERLRELVPKPETGNGRALVIAKQDAINEAMQAAGIRLGRVRHSRRHANLASHAAGRAAGDRASFGRPVEGAGVTLRIGRAAS